MAPVSLEIQARCDFADGKPFGTAGAYEKISGAAHYAVDPQSPAARTVVDIDLAPRCADGLIRFSGDFCILRPNDPTKGNGRLVFEVLNRGNKKLFRDLMDARIAPDGSGGNDPTSEADIGNAFLLRQGYTLAWAAWQGDIIDGDGRMLLHLPDLLGDAGTLNGVVRSEMLVEDRGVAIQRLSGNDHTRGYPVATFDKAKARLTVRARSADEPREIATDAWDFAVLDEAGHLVPSALHCHLKQGFEPGSLYELTYVAERPLPLGLGFLAVQEFVTRITRHRFDSLSVPEASDGLEPRLVPLAWGMSQSARFLREFIYRGYNRTDDGQQVFAGIVAHVAGAGRIQLNLRFAQPGRFPQQHKETDYPSDEFPFAYVSSRDPFTGQVDAIMRQPDTDPFVIHTQTSAEYWERRGSLVHTDSEGRRLPGHARVRIYAFANAQHDASCQFVPSPTSVDAHRNMLRTTALNRALLLALDGWVVRDIPPPPSAVPKLEDGTADDAAAVLANLRLPAGTRLPAEANRLFFKSFGPEFARGRIQEPPAVNRRNEYRVIMPSTDDEGREKAGLATPELLAPLATHMGWSVRPERRGDVGGAAVLGGVHGTTIPLPPTAELRQAQADPRLSVEERYGSRENYVAAVRASAEQLVTERILLGEDAETYIAESGPAFSAAMRGIYSIRADTSGADVDRASTGAAHDRPERPDAAKGSGAG